MFYCTVEIILTLQLLDRWKEKNSPISLFFCVLLLPKIENLSLSDVCVLGSAINLNFMSCNFVLSVFVLLLF